MLYSLARSALFKLDPEVAHDLALKSLVALGPAAGILGAGAARDETRRVMGIDFPNPVGLAAGMDKTAQAVPAWAAFGFGFSEMGGVTWHPQPGNPQPRMFRIVPDEALINRMGFNNPGAEAMAKKLCEWREQGRWPQHPVGINLGKSKITPLERAAEDYANSFRILRDLVDFFVINVSSPNTPGLRQLQDKSALDEILTAMQQENFVRKPILVKVAPDLSFEAVDEILELAKARNISGIVATNTTISRPQTNDSHSQKMYAETGGLSGKPLRRRSTEIIRHIYKQTRGHLPIVGVGGIFNADDAWEKISAGASLIQIYTGMIYEGPAIAKIIVSGLAEKLQKAGLKDLRTAVGSKN